MLLTTEDICCEMILVALRSRGGIFPGPCAGIVEAIISSAYRLLHLLDVP